MTRAVDVHRQHEAAMLDLHGLTPSTRSRCPRVLARRRCAAWKASCVCLSRALDHLHAWTDRDGRRVLTAEPYQVDGPDLAWLLLELDVLGLDVTASGGSAWFPGSTFLLTIRRGPEGTR